MSTARIPDGAPQWLADVALILDRVRHQLTLTPDERAAVKRLQDEIAVQTADAAPRGGHPSPSTDRNLA